MAQQKHNSYKNRKGKASLVHPSLPLFPILHSDALFVDFIFIQVQRDLLSAYKYGGPEVVMK